MTKWTENVTSSLGYDFVNRSTLTNITPKSSLLARRTNISTEGPEKVAKAVVEILTFNAKHYQDTKKKNKKRNWAGQPIKRQTVWTHVQSEEPEETRVCVRVCVISEVRVRLLVIEWCHYLRRRVTASERPCERV